MVYVHVISVCIDAGFPVCLILHLFMKIKHIVSIKYTL